MRFDRWSVIISASVALITLTLILRGRWVGESIGFILLIVLLLSMISTVFFLYKK